MLADAVHSLSDFITDAVVLVFVGISARPQDRSHDFGHGKSETVATLFIGLALAAWLQGASLPSPGRIALWCALLSIVVKEGLYRYTARKGKALASKAVVANAWHHRSDALSSIGAAIGIAGAIFLGERWTVLDPIASIVVGALLVKVAWELLGPSIGELTEQSLPDETEKDILELIESVEGVSEPHNLRTRRIGNHIAAEVHIRLDGALPLSEAHEKASAIERLFEGRYGKGSHMIIHMEPRNSKE